MANIKNAVVYARYSSHRQGEQSIEGQLAEAYKYAALHGLRIIHEYIDRAMTGRNDNREQFQAMLRDTEKGMFDTIILWKVDRFGRNREEIALNKHRCRENGVDVVYVAEYIPSSAEGVILESVLEGMAEYYSLQLSQNILRGQRASAEKCQCTGGNRPLGYSVDPQTKKFVINPEEAPTVRLIFDLYAQGKTTADIVRILNSKGLRNTHGKTFTKNSLHSVLKNEKYIGVYTYKDIIRVEDGVPAIVDKEKFNKVQDMLKINKKAPSRTWSYADYILTDKLFCGHCGSKMYGECGTSKSGAKHSYYICSKRKRERACDKRAVRKDWIEDAVLKKVTSILQDDDKLIAIANSVYAYYVKQQKADDLTASLRAKLDEVDKAQTNLLKAIEAGLFSPAAKKRMDELDIQRSELESELTVQDAIKSSRLTKDQILYFLRSLRNLDITNRKCQQQLIKTFVNSIFVFDDRIIITFNYSCDDRTVTLSDIDALSSPDSEAEVFGCCAPNTTKKRQASFDACRFLVLLHLSLSLFRSLKNEPLRHARSPASGAVC